MGYFEPGVQPRRFGEQDCFLLGDLVCSQEEHLGSEGWSTPPMSQGRVYMWVGCLSMRSFLTGFDSHRDRQGAGLQDLLHPLATQKTITHCCTKHAVCCNDRNLVSFVRLSLQRKSV